MKKVIQILKDAVETLTRRSPQLKPAMVVPKDRRPQPTKHRGSV
ncbi:MAG: hypothetical protein ABW036_01910 [Flavitalea sp.]